MAEFFTQTGLGMGLLMVGQVLLIMLPLLLCLAFLMYADRKIWAAVQMRRGPQRRGCLGPAPVLCRPAEVCREGGRGARRGGPRGLLPGADDQPRHGAHRLGGDPLQRGLGPVGHQRGHPLCLRHLLARGLRRDHGRLGLQLQVSFPGLAALRRADDLLRGLHRAHHHRGHHLGRLHEPEAPSSTPRRGAGGILNWFFLPHFPMLFLFFISALAETNRPPFDLPEAESELVAGYQVEYSSTPFLLFMIGELVARGAHVCPGVAALPRRPG